MNTPTENDAIIILKKSLNKKAIKVKRFSTGSQHYVYDVLTEDNKNFVVRIGNEESRGYMAGAVFWHNILEKKGLPLPKFLFSEVEKKLFEFPVIIMERLEGKDLGDVYSQLSEEQKKKLAIDISNIQTSVSTLPQANGFGYAKAYDDKLLKQSWLELIQDQFERTKRRMTDAKVFDFIYWDKVNDLISENTDYLSNVMPVAFLDDTTTKNVMVNNGALSGLVDIDFVCFGDPLYVVSLTKMALLSGKIDTKYVDYWCENIEMTKEKYKILNLYTIIHCVGFMSEMGHKFNKEVAEVDQKRVEKLKNIFESLIKEYNSL